MPAGPFLSSGYPEPHTRGDDVLKYSIELHFTTVKAFLCASASLWSTPIYCNCRYHQKPEKVFALPIIRPPVFILETTTGQIRQGEAGLQQEHYRGNLPFGGGGLLIPYAILAGKLPHNILFPFHAAMSKSIHRAFCIYVAAAAAAPLSIYGEDVPVAANNQPGLAQATHVQNPGAPYGHHHTPADPSTALPNVPMHAPYGYVAHDPSLPPNSMMATPKQFALWEQSSGSIELLTHSWQPPLTQENLSHWDVAMSTVPSEEHVVLMPGDANRTGQFWHRNAIPAVHFEVQFGFGVSGKDQGVHEAAGGLPSGVNIPDGFAFWYVYEPYASVYPRSPEAQATWNLVGYKSNPKGFGVIFKVLDRNGHVKPSISCVHNTEDGRALAEEIPTPSAFFYQYRNQAAPVLFRVIVSHQGVVAQIRQSITSPWITACSLDHVLLHPHGFIGFTGHNRPAAGQVQQVAGQEHHQQASAQQQGGDQVLIYFVKLWSLDSMASSRHDQVSQHPVVPAQVHHMPNDPHAQHAHVEHYGGIPDPIHTPPHMHPTHTIAEQTMLRMLTSLGNQISMLSVEVSDLRHDVRKLWDEDGPDAVKSLKSELTGFKDLFKRHSHQHTSALHTIHKHVETKSGTAKDGHSPILSRLTDLSSQLEKDIALKHAHSFLLSVAALVLVVLFAFCSWKKLRAIEKKHML